MRPLPIAGLCVVTLVLCACAPSESVPHPSIGMANPAAVNCIKLGGQLTLKHTPQGEVGMCQLPSGQVCEEWALFRGTCS